MSKLMMAFVMSGVALSGCTKLPTVFTPAAEVERVVVPHNHPVHSPAPVAEGQVGIPGLYVNHGLLSEAGAGLNVNHQTPVQAAYGTVAADSTAPGVAATLDIASKSNNAFRAFPVFASESVVSDVLVSPATAKATWKLTANGMPIVAKVKFTLTDDQGLHPEVFETNAADFNWPRVFQDTHEVSFGLDHDRLMHYFNANPKLKGSVKLTATPEDFNGQAIQTKAGKPLELALSLKVL
jgi:hypothetical protein